MPFGGEKNIGLQRPELSRKIEDPEMEKTNGIDVEPTDADVIGDKTAAIEDGIAENSSRMEQEIAGKKVWLDGGLGKTARVIGAAAALFLGANKVDAGDVYKTGGPDIKKYKDQKTRNFNDPQYRFDENTRQKYESGKPETFQVVVRDDKGGEQIYNVPKGMASQPERRDYTEKEPAGNFIPGPISKLPATAEETWHPAGKSPVREKAPAPAPSAPAPAESGPRIENKAESREEAISRHVLKAYRELSLSKSWPHQVLTMELSIAQQLAESNFKEDAVSRVGAVGTMQNYESIGDIPGFLARLSKKKIKLSDGRDFSYDGPLIPDIRKDPAGHQRVVGIISQYILKDSDLSRAFGNLFMFKLYLDGVGKKFFDQGDIKNGVGYMLAAYNMGQGNLEKRPHEKDWFPETKAYVPRVHRFREQIVETKNDLVRNAVYLPTAQANYFSMQLVRLIRSRPNQEGPIRAKYYQYLADAYQSKKGEISNSEIKYWFEDPVVRNQILKNATANMDYRAEKPGKNRKKP